MVKLVLFVVLVLSVTIQGATNDLTNNENSFIDQLTNILDIVKEFVSVIAELVVNLNKIRERFSTQLVGNENTPSTLLKSSQLVLATTMDTENCTNSEGENLVTLLLNTTNAVDVCLSNLTFTGNTLAHNFYDVFSNISQLITNTTSTVTQCIETKNTLELSQCIIQLLYYVNIDIGVVINQVDKILPTVMNAGELANTVSSCFTSIAKEFLSGIYDIFIDFVKCIEKL